MQDQPDPYADLAAPFLRHYGELRGAVRTSLVHGQLLDHVPSAPADVVDVGGGSARQSAPLAELGHRVTVVDPSATMLAAAGETVAALGPDAAARMRLVRADGAGAAQALGGDLFDVVLCHGVVMYLDDPLALLRALVDLARPGAIVSIVAKNASALAMRAGMQGRWSDALAVVDATGDVGGVGVRTRGDDPDELAATMAGLGCEMTGWYGVRLFTDHLTGVPIGSDAADAIALEDACARRDPYRRVSRLFHLVCRRTAPAAASA